MDDKFEKGVEHSGNQDMLQRGVDGGGGAAQRAQNCLVGVRALLLDGDHFVYQPGKARSLGAAENELARLQVRIGVVEHIEHAGPGEFDQHLRLPFAGKLSELPLRVGKAGDEVPVVFAHQRLKERLFAFVVAVKGAGGHAQGFYNASQGRGAEPFFQELRPRRPMDALQRGQSLFRHGFPPA